MDASPLWTPCCATKAWPKHRGSIAAALLLWSLALCAAGQPVYRFVGSDGKVTFSDQPPSAVTNAAIPGASDKSSTDAGTGPGTDTGTGASSSNPPALPYTLRQVVRKFPVTLYAGNDCAPCNSARALLRQRGIPYTEHTVNSAEDIAALQHLAGDASVPYLTVGNQRLTGFSEVDWTQTFDAAGYPPSSQLPTSYRPPPASPLVPAAPARTTPHAPTAVTAPAPPAAPPDLRTPTNPAGIQF